MNFIRREFIYIWMVIFILGVNLLGPAHPHKKDAPDKKTISSMTFKDMGITEAKVKSFFESGRPSALFFKYGFFIGFFMLMLGIAMNLLFFLGKKEIMSGANAQKRPVSWDMSDIVRVVIITVFSGYVLSAAGGAVLKSLHFNIDTNLKLMLATLLIDIIAGAAIIYLALFKYRENLSSLGIVFSNFYKNVISGITAYIFILPLLIASLIISILFLEAIGYKAPSQPVFDVLLEEKRGSAILFFTIFVSVAGPIMEELFFRGFLYSAIRKRFGVFTGVLLSGALFSSLHANLAGFLPIMILGALMAFIYEVTGSLVASASVHILHNSIIVGFIFFIKEIIR
ncbi:MAG: CPBP family intramembrane metalloprotease [Candidatus Omnitrophota bacterium]|nr:CPBP family intramembrane metalloprotease [Candidatus Omnitrophota bacterium]